MNSTTLRILSRLLAYPDTEMQAALPEMAKLIETDTAISRSTRERLVHWMTTRAATPLLALQEEYVGLFDRGRHLSLHLFEHVHGESRDRGQAMVDLTAHYRSHGYALAARELPDHLPLMLEFLSTRDDNGSDLLADAMPVVVMLGARLHARGSDFALIFEALESMGGGDQDSNEVRRQVAIEGPDDTLERMDEIWEEEQVTFLAGADPSRSGCAMANDNRTQQVTPPAMPPAARQRANG